MECQRSVAVAHAPLAEVVGSAPCGTDGCVGAVVDRFRYGAQAQLVGVAEGRCAVCGQRKLREATRAKSKGSRRASVPDPRTRLPS
ncbi:hypothetical protein ABT168_00590 [Streptomyces sp. NPDC001793]|uniref:hypothetical protein n=1 Tax=Streptomyces sp. NPDC001793 TaxID=3154657 RepID=UPI00331FFE8B